MAELTVKAPAKINLHLKVKNRRPDGFHGIESVFLALNFGDTLHFTKIAQKGALEIDMGAPAGWGLAIPTEKNIVFKAVSLFREKTGFQQGLKIRVEKHIPLGAGLGGGSSDAASALLALNSLAASASPGGKCPLADDSLAEMAALLGSDVPFFVQGCHAAWVSGRGEYIQPISIPSELAVVLVNPGFSSDTAAAYRLLDQWRDEKGQAGAGVPDHWQAGRLEIRQEALVHALTRPPGDWPFENDFLPVLKEAEYGDILHQLRELEAGFANLSGSGSSCFGIFLDREKAENAAANLSKKFIFVKLTFLLAK